jgi:RNA-directed DNA polymerase
LRQHLYYLKKLGPIEHAKARQFDTLGGMYRHIRGLIDFANIVEPDYAAGRLAEFNAIDGPMDS